MRDVRLRKSARGQLLCPAVMPRYQVAIFKRRLGLLNTSNAPASY
jgi:hypothetical protein